MARRRALGAGFDAAGSIIDLYIKDKMERARQASLQAQISARERVNRLMTDISSGAYGKLRPEEQELYGAAAGVDLPVKSNEDILNQGIASFTKADTRSKLPTKEEAVADVRYGGGMLKTGEDALRLLRARSSREEQLAGAETPALVKSYEPERGMETSAYMRPADLTGLGAFQTGPTGAQAGRDEGAKAVAESQQPGFMQSVEDKAYAAQHGQERAGILDPNVFARRLQLATEQARASAAATGDAQWLKDQNESTNALISTLPDLFKIAELAPKVNISEPTDVVGRIGQKLGAITQIDPNATMLDTLSRTTAMKLINTKFGGNKGATSENDVRGLLNRFPKAGDSAEMSRRKMEQLWTALTETEQLVNSLPRTMSPVEKFNIARERFGLSAIPDGGAATGSATYQSLFGQPQK